MKKTLSGINVHARDVYGGSNWTISLWIINECFKRNIFPSYDKGFKFSVTGDQIYVNESSHKSYRVV